MDRTSDNNLGATLPVLGLFVATLLAALAYFSAPGWMWATTSAWVGLALIAALAQSDPTRRAYLTATLKHSRYTQLYLSIARPVNDWVWRRVGRMQVGAYGTPRPPNERTDLLALMRAALTARLLDKALLVAVAYPIVALLVQWIFGNDAVLGAGVVVFLPEAGFWPNRAIAAMLFLSFAVGVAGRWLASTNSLLLWRRHADWLPAFLVASIFAVAVAVAGPLATSDAIEIAATFAVVFSVAVVVALVGAGTVAIAIAGAMAAVGAVAVAGAIVGAVAVAWLSAKGRPGAAMAVLATGWVTGMVAVALFGDIAALRADRKAIFVFLAVLPFINGLFDTLSYAATLATMRKGLVTRWAWALGVLDLLIGAVLFLALGATMVAVIAALNALGNAPLFDLAALFAGLRSDPGEYWWLYLILFSTLLPTALHLGIAALAVQGIFPPAWRRRVARWIEASPTSALDAVLGCFWQAAIWWLPLMALAGLGYALWLWLRHAAGMVGLFYLDSLETLALWIGAL